MSEERAFPMVCEMFLQCVHRKISACVFTNKTIVESAMASYCPKQPINCSFKSYKCFTFRSYLYSSVCAASEVCPELAELFKTGSMQHPVMPFSYVTCWCVYLQLHILSTQRSLSIQSILSSVSSSVLQSLQYGVGAKRIASTEGNKNGLMAS